ncbi:MAG: NAD(P)-dependent alcohol dehydrogenase [Planctomycetota bacterium]
MKAMGVSGYGSIDRLRVLDVPEPMPGAAEVRVRVVASALNPADWKVIEGSMRFLHGRADPLILGYDVSGTIEATGRAVDQFHVGDAVFGFLPYGPFNRRGAFAEVVNMRADEIARKPPSISHRSAAAAATPGLTALQGIADLGRLPPGGRLMITGVSGGVGSIGVGIGVRLGAEVVAVGSGAGLEFARRMGATVVWDRTRGAVPSGAMGRFDVVFDAAAHYRWRDWRTAIRPGGAFVTTLPSAAFFADKACTLLTRTRVHLVAVKSRRDALERVAHWLADGLAAPIDSVIPVRDVAAGLERLKGGHVRGRIVVDVADGFGGG